MIQASDLALFGQATRWAPRGALLPLFVVAAAEAAKVFARESCEIDDPLPSQTPMKATSSSAGMGGKMFAHVREFMLEPGGEHGTLHLNRGHHPHDFARSSQE